MRIECRHCGTLNMPGIPCICRKQTPHTLIRMWEDRVGRYKADARESISRKENDLASYLLTVAYQWEIALEELKEVLDE